MSRDNPWFKFYPADWRADASLRSCSLAARGLWIEMISIMHDATPYGHLTVNGRPVTVAQLALLTGTLPDQLPDLLGELETAGVYSVNSKGVIYSRRMTRDAKKAGTARKNGKAGGNPNLCNSKENPASDNHEVKPPDNPGVKPQRPEARSQRDHKPTRLMIPSGVAHDPKIDAAVVPVSPVLADVQRRIGEVSYRSWFAKADVRQDGDGITLLLPSAFVREYVETHFRQHFPPATRFVFERGQA